MIQVAIRIIAGWIEPDLLIIHITVRDRTIKTFLKYTIYAGFPTISFKI